MEILYDEIGFTYLTKLSHPSLTLFQWMCDESRCIRPICGLRGRQPPADQSKAPKRKNDFDYERRGTVPETRLTEFFKTFISFESFAFVGLLICVQQFLYDITYMPVKAISMSFTILVSLIDWPGRRTASCAFRRLSTRAMSGASPTVADDAKSCRLPQLATAPGFALLRNLIELRHRLRWLFNREIDSTAISNLSSFLVCVCSFWLFNRFITFAAAYHFIRSQSLLKLYVLFNVLEVVDKIWRSLERDALYELIVTMRGMLTPQPRQVSLQGGMTERVAGTEEHPPRFERASSDKTHENERSATEKIGVERICRVAGGENQWLRIICNLIICVVCVSTHMVMHLARGLLLCISMNSEPSAMFLLLFSNNWAEIKSTVFKKQTALTLFTVAAGDVIERFQVFTDALFVYLQMNSALKHEVGTSSAAKVLMWLVLMLSVEISVDFLKHAFLIKFNNYSSQLFSSYEWILAYDFLVGRSATLLLTKQVEPLRSPPVNLLGMASFPRIPAERLGFQTLALLTFLLSCVPLNEFAHHPVWAVTAAVLLWIVLVLLNNILTLYMLLFCVRRVSESPKVEGGLIALAPL